MQYQANVVRIKYYFTFAVFYDFVCAKSKMNDIQTYKDDVLITSKQNMKTKFIFYYYHNDVKNILPTKKTKSIPLK